MRLSFLRKKVKSLKEKKDPYHFVKGKRKLKPLLRIQRSSYDKRGICFVYEKHDKYQNNFFVKVTPNASPFLKCNFSRKSGHISQSCIKKQKEIHNQNL